MISKLLLTLSMLATFNAYSSDLETAFAESIPTVPLTKVLDSMTDLINRNRIPRLRVPKSKYFSDSFVVPFHGSKLAELFKKLARVHILLNNKDTTQKERERLLRMRRSISSELTKEAPDWYLNQCDQLEQILTASEAESKKAHRTTIKTDFLRTYSVLSEQIETTIFQSISRETVKDNLETMIKSLSDEYKRILEKFCKPIERQRSFEFSTQGEKTDEEIKAEKIMEHLMVSQTNQERKKIKIRVHTGTTKEEQSARRFIKIPTFIEQIPQPTPSDRFGR